MYTVFGEEASTTLTVRSGLIVIDLIKLLLTLMVVFTAGALLETNFPLELRFNVVTEFDGLENRPLESRTSVEVALLVLVFFVFFIIS